ncbi:MAG: NAD(P)/FAD-dependent oxidoreductase, partial [Gammaproteobacteria bacterium]|nr:NAD(P)/FAD-dependent oxidoreductase [Gammaproteobacteria bacterium]
KVAIIEKFLPGGTCLNQGCVPKEAILRLARILGDVNRLEGRGLVGRVQGDFVAALHHQRELVENIRATLLPWLRQLGIKFYAGSAKVVAADTVLITPNDPSTTPQEIIAKKIIIATGAAPRRDPVCIPDGQRIIDTRDFMFNLDRKPNNVLWVGGGAIGCELGYAMRQFGVNVTVVEQGDRLLNRGGIAERASQTLERKFAQMGIKVIKNACVAQLDKSSDDNIKVQFSDGQQGEYDTILVAVGRVPHIEGLGLAEIGVECDEEGFIVTNEYLETTVPNIYAVGDVKRGPMTANSAFHDAKIATLNALNGNRELYNYNRVPIVIDTALPIATVGLSEDRAELAGFEPDVARANLAGSTIARIHHGGEGYIEVVHDAETGQLLGGNIVGPQAGEMINMLTAACQSQRGLWFFTDMSYSHPSWNEELENAIARSVAAFNRSEEEVFRPGIYAID